MGTRVTRTFDMCPCKRATGPPALQSRHLPRVEGVGFTGGKQATIRGVGFHFPRAFFFALLHTPWSRFTPACFVRALSLSLFPPPPRSTRCRGGGRGRRRRPLFPRTSAGLLVTRAPAQIIKIPKRTAGESGGEPLCRLARGQSGPLVDSRVN